MKLVILFILALCTNSAYAEEYPCPPDTDVCADKDENGFCDKAEEEEPPPDKDEDKDNSEGDG